MKAVWLSFFIDENYLRFNYDTFENKIDIDLFELLNYLSMYHESYHTKLEHIYKHVGISGPKKRFRKFKQ